MNLRIYLTLSLLVLINPVWGVEKEIVVTGNVKSYVIEGENESIIQSWLYDNQGNRYELIGMDSGMAGVVEIKGFLSDNNKSIQVNEINHTQNTLNNKSVQSWSSQYAFGLESPDAPQRAALLLMNFNDATNTAITDLDEVVTAVFTHAESVNEKFQEYSRYKTSYTGDINDLYGPWEIDLSEADCDADLLLYYTLQAAFENGVDLSIYDRYLISFPPNSGTCHTSATLFEHPSSVYLGSGVIKNAPSSLSLHEQGHNYGLRHSHRLDSCSDPSFPTIDTCTYVEYGSPVDIMGKSIAYGHPMPYQAMRLGWMGTDDTESITNVDGSGTFTIEPVAASTAGNKGLIIPRSWDASTGVIQAYVVEYRQPVNADHNLSNHPGFTNGITIHLVNYGGFEPEDNIFLLDMTNATSGNVWDQTLQTGLSFTDSTSGITITLDSLTAAAAQVTVAIVDPAGSCTPANPSLNVNTIRSLLGEGETNVYEVTVTNNDSTGCHATSFELSGSSLPFNWSAQAIPTAIALPAGASTTWVLRLTSSAALLGNYDFDVVVTDQSDSNHTASVSASYQLTDCSRASPTLSYSESTLNVIAGGTVSVDVQMDNNNTGNCEDLVMNPATYVPDGWGSAGLSNVTVSSGQNDTQTWNITPDVNAPVGTRGAGILLKQKFSDGSQQYGVATAHLSINIVECTEMDPTVTFTTVSATGEPAESLDYPFTVTNNNSASCSDEIFDLSRVLPTNFTGILTDSILTIASGVTANSSIAVSSASDSIDDDYVFDVTATGQTSTLSHSDQATYTVFDSYRLLTVMTAGNGFGNITFSGKGIDCGSQNNDCDEELDVNNVYTLFATPDYGSIFTVWSGDCSGSNDSVQVTMSQDIQCTATFEIDPDVIFINGFEYDPNPDIENKVIIQVLDAPKKSTKSLFTNKVCPVLVNSLCTSITCTLKLVSIPGFE